MKQSYTMIEGGVCAPQGFTAGGVACGVKKGSTKLDVAVIVSEIDCAAAAVYTTNKVKAAPLYQTMQHLQNGQCKAVIANSGNANACAINGMEHAQAMCKAAGDLLSIPASDFIVASTGVIGQELNIAAITENIKHLKLSSDGSKAAATAIMTTDLVEKSVAIEFVIGGKTCKMGAIAKGSGMIHPNMGTMLAFVTTDCAITADMLNVALHTSTKKTYNMVSVDGDTSTNDMCTVMANGLAGNELIHWENDDFKAFYKALDFVNTTLARKIAADGEGATKLITCIVQNSRDEETAAQIAKSVAASSLVKTAMFGSDANWGRVLCAMGYSKAAFRPEYIDISFRSKVASIMVCEDGMGLDFDEDLAKKILSEKEVEILIDSKEGAATATAWGCDLTYDYVKINGDYRT